MYTIDIDVGGTFTDGFFTRGDETRQRKVHTTPHDLTVGIGECISAGAEAFGLSSTELLRETGVIRLSTTIGTNAIIQRRGPRIGLLVTAGAESTFYGTQPRDAVSESFVSPNMVRGIHESVDERGNILKPLDEAEVIESVRELVRLNARVIVVSLKNSPANPTHERRIRDLIEDRYPTHYLRYVPAQISSDVSDIPADEARTYSAIFNAYLHSDMARTLYKAEDMIRNLGYRRPLLIVHTNGGVARVAKTMAINTYGSGPAGGLVGAAEAMRLYDAPNVITSDVGGTSVDIGILTRDGYALNLRPSIEGLPLTVPMIDLVSIGSGGGSIARVRDGVLTVGPDSAGAAPGPAAYDRGGTEPTVTDADVVLGYYDPDNFLGGKMQLNRQRAVDAIQTKVAEPLGISVEEAAFRIKQTVDLDIGTSLAELIRAAGKDPADFLLLGFGGAGPAHACGYGDAAGIPRILTFPFGSVFNAYGASRMDVTHTYLRSLGIPISESELSFEADWSPVGPTVETLKARALNDMRGEGFDASQVDFSLEVVVNSGGNGARALVGSPSVAPDSEATRTIVESYRRARPAQSGNRKLEAEAVVLKATAALPHYHPVEHPLGSADASAARNGERQAYWGNGYQATPVYDTQKLQPGNVIAGPAIFEGPDTTYVLPPNKKFTVDRYRNGLIENV